MKPLLLVLDDNVKLADTLLASKTFEQGHCEARQFPDNESYIRLLSDCRNRDVVILCSLHNPDSHILPLLFCAQTAKELQAKSVGLISPYLAYMRQDTRFQPGEAISAAIFAGILSNHFDWLATIDPHLHRFHSLDDIYHIPTYTLSTTTLVGQWIRNEVQQPLLIGPDSESEQWVSAVAGVVDAPYVVLEKIRRGDRQVDIAFPDFTQWNQCTPVLVDDMISTGGTLIKVTSHLQTAGLAAPVCIAVHGLFTGDAEARIRDAGVQRLITSNTIAHHTNEIDVSQLLIAMTNDIFH